MRTLTKTLVFLARDWRNALLSSLDTLAGPGDGEIMFQCNVCGRRSKTALAHLTREERTCRCGSTVRLRSLVHLLTNELFGHSIAIGDIPAHPEIIGIDMSGAATYADRLARRLGYTNTFLHKEPRLDITKPGQEWLSKCDFVISSDVFEHVAPPVSIAFDNVMRLLKPGGLFILTVPWVATGPTMEHFPGLSDYDIEWREKRRVLVNRLPDGQTQEYAQLVFHGGEGETLEMRIFSKSGLIEELERAGFQDICIHGEAVDQFGILWKDPWSLPVTARRPS